MTSRKTLTLNATTMWRFLDLESEVSPFIMVCDCCFLLVCASQANILYDPLPHRYRHALKILALCISHLSPSVDNVFSNPLRRTSTRSPNPPLKTTSWRTESRILAASRREVPAPALRRQTSPLPIPQHVSQLDYRAPALQSRPYQRSRTMD